LRDTVRDREEEELQKINHQRHNYSRTDTVTEATRLQEGGMGEIGICTNQQRHELFRVREANEASIT
jgi:hypothetical protein